MGALAILQSLMQIAASPGGLAILDRLFADHGLTPDKLSAVIAALPDAPPPKPPDGTPAQ